MALTVYSRFLQRLHRRYADELPLLPAGPPSRDSLGAAFAALKAKGLKKGLATLCIGGGEGTAMTIEMI